MEYGMGPDGPVQDLSPEVGGLRVLVPLLVAYMLLVAGLVGLGLRWAL
jgi:hypothetical protein